VIGWRGWGGEPEGGWWGKGWIWIKKNQKVIYSFTAIIDEILPLDF
jgi:hypothetical protein